jgi:hypothetical protein
MREILLRREDIKFKEDYGYYFFVGKDKYDLCACVKCKKVHAIYVELYLSLCDRIIKCCEKPKNFMLSLGAEEMIKEFLEEWK